MPGDDATPVGRLEGAFGPNVGLVEEIYRQWLDDPESVAESWRDFFEDYTPRLPADRAGNGGTAAGAEPPAPASPPAPPERPPEPRPGDGARGPGGAPPAEAA